ncbi:Hypothetical protein NTJ_04867 [Nesidiocoris tenuis]|uniref:DUF7041 domain-containing protein n=1 Tax=Nesidiocoris tenuis TaxID=355587 RepID=A0ABN7AKW3_9HEMI|nr:Hypothetical protein NTJ_04867 [Nesidiocoris tenuis]
MNTGGGRSNDPTTECDRIDMKIPPFWSSKPALWFASLEAQFNLGGITRDITKYWHVVSKLDCEQAAIVEDVITNPPIGNAYDKIKTELVNRLSASQEMKLKQLLESEEIGDRNPSRFLRHLQSLAGQNVPIALLRTLWIGRLPVNIQTILATQPDTASLEDLGKLADKINEIVPTQPVTAATSSNNQYNDIQQQIAALTEKVEVLTFPNKCKCQKRQRFRSRSPVKQNQYQKDEDLCYYHRTYGAKAHKCVPPCSYQENYNGNH